MSAVSNARSRGETKTISILGEIWRDEAWLIPCWVSEESNGDGGKIGASYGEVFWNILFKGLRLPVHSPWRIRVQVIPYFGVYGFLSSSIVSEVFFSIIYIN